MKKAFIAVAAITLMGSLVCQADVNVTWNGLGTNPVLDESGASSPNTFWAQLIWTQESATSPIVNPSDPLVPVGGDIVLQQQELNGFGLPGLIVGPGAQTYTDPTLVGGYVYTRVFDSQTAPTLYGDSTNLSEMLKEFNPTDASTLHVHNPMGIVVDQVIIPEPGTLALLAVGLGTVLFRRRR